MSVLRKVQHEPGDGHADFIFWCPGCRCGHGVWVSGPNQVTGASWSWNGSVDKPTFQPSLRIEHPTHVPPVTPENLEEYRRQPWPQTKKVHICHSIVTDGVIHFCADSTHALAGQSIPMEDF